jgi:hypothetical protein
MAWQEAEMEWKCEQPRPVRLRLTYKIQQGAPAYFAGNFADSRPAEGDDLEILRAFDLDARQETALTDQQIHDAGDYVIKHHDWDEEPWSPFNREDDRDG